jgi:uncharacterized membrane protein
MIRLLIKLLGVKIDAAQNVSGVSFHLRNGGALGWPVVFALLLGGFTWWVYRYLGGHRDLQAPRRRLLTGLRMALFFFLLLLVLGPELSFSVETRLRRSLILLIDASASMDIQDQRLDRADLKRAAIGKDLVRKVDQTLSASQTAQIQHISRVDLVKAVFANPNFDLLNQFKARYDLAFYQFDRGVSALSTAEQALTFGPESDPARQSTDLGDAVRDIVSRKRGQPVAGIFLVSDGAANSGSDPLEAARSAGGDKMPIYAYGVGITEPRDVIVDSVFTPDVAFIKDQVSVTVRFRGQGLEKQKGRLRLRLGDQEVAAQDVQYTGAEQSVSLSFTPQETGEFELAASIPPRDDETVKDNNTASQRLRIIDSKIKVLFVEQTPRWEFRFAQTVLLRDRRVDPKFVLLSADPQLARAPGSPFLEKFPTSKEDIFKYDLIILGDVDPSTFAPDALQNLNEFVTKFGGAMIFIAGQAYDPIAYAKTPLEKMLPIEWDSFGGATAPAGVQRPTTLALTPSGRTDPMLKLSPDERENTGIWKSFGPILWINRVSRSKAGAQVLLEDTDPATTTRTGRMPAVAFQQYGVGQVLYIGTDDFWRWRQEADLAYYPLLWGQIVQRMALPHLLGGAKRTQLSVDKQRYTAGDRVTVFARLYDAAFQPVKEASVDGSYVISPGPGKPAGAAQKLELRAVPDQPGTFRGEFVPVDAGVYKFSMSSDPRTTLDFSVTRPRFESGESAMNEPLLKEMARVSGGAFFREEDLAGMPDKLLQTDERISRTVEADLWSSPFYFGLLALLAVAEWILRKRYELK